MKKILFLAIILLPPPIFSIQNKKDKEYYKYDDAMGSLVPKSTNLSTITIKQN